VPGVVGSGQEAAIEELKEAGFKVTVRRDGVYIGLGYVVSQIPGSGDEAPRGSIITIYIV